MLPSTRCFFGVDVEVAGRCLPVDLRVLKMVDYDVIFGMDWLRRYRVHVQCFEHRVVFRPEGEPEFHFRGSLSLRHQPFLSLLEARRLMTSGCDSFLTCVTSSSVRRSGSPHFLCILCLLLVNFLIFFLRTCPVFHLTRRWQTGQVLKKNIRKFTSNRHRVHRK